MQVFLNCYRMATVWLWAILEASIDDLCVEVMREGERWRQVPALAEIKGPLLEFVTASEDARARILLESLKLQVRAPLKVGVGRFEEILGAVGLGGGVDRDVRRVLLELSETRNLMVHRRGEVDDAFVRACPFLKVTPGQHYVITSRRYNAYYFAVAWYNLEMIDRLLMLKGGTRDKSAGEGKEDFVKLMRECLTANEAATDAGGGVG